MLLYPVLEELVPRQEDRLEFPIVDFGQADTAEHSSPSMSPKRLQEAADDFVGEVGSRGIPLNNRNQEGVRISCQEQVEEIFGEGMLAVVGSGD